MSPRDPLWLQRLEALYAFALRLYPRSFRDEWEASLRQAFRDRCREVARGERKPLALLSELLPDLAASAGRERFLTLQDATMFKRNLAIALLVLFGAMVVFHQKVGDVASEAQQWWTQRQERLDREATEGYWVAAGNAVVANAASPRDNAIAGLLYAGAKDPRAQEQWDKAVAATDPMTLWISVLDCPVANCDVAGALASLARREPDNAAVAQLRLEAATREQDRAGMDSALHAIATASHYDGHQADLMHGLLRAGDGVPVPARLRRNYKGSKAGEVTAGLLAASVWMGVAQPAMAPFMDYCKPGAGGGNPDDCLAASRTLAEGDTLLARIIGQRAWYRIAHDETESALVRQRMRDLRWLIANIQGDMDDADDVIRWRDAWLASDGEVGAYQRLMRERGIALAAPAEFEVEAKYFDPGR